MQIRIERFRKYPQEVLGLLYIGEVPRFTTIENPKYLIPAGKYKAIRDLHNGRYEVWELLLVPGRTQIQIHIANLAKQLLGCIGIGYKFGDIGGENAVIESTRAFYDFMDRTSQEEELFIEICEKY